MDGLRDTLLALGLPGLFLIALLDSAGVPLPGEEVSIGVPRAGRELELTATLDQDRGRRPRRDIFRDDGRAI